jgi:tricorn protease
LSLTLSAASVVLLLSQGAQTATIEPRLMRTPAIHGETIVFSYAGDLWVTTVGGGAVARRLTSHPGLEIRPKISPDGRWVAFNGTYDGNPEVYVVPIEGGEPRRLTYEPGTGNTLGWTPDGKIAYASAQGNHTTRQQRLWYVDPRGGLPIWTPIAEISEASFLADGRTMAYTRVNSYNFNWRRYRGGTQGRISLYNFATNNYSELPAAREQNYFPMAVGRSVYYVSDKQLGTLNLFRYDLDSRRETQLTRYADADIRWPSTDGKSIVWERDGFLYVFDVATGNLQRQSPRIPSEHLAARPVLRQLGNQISSISISPSGNRIAAEARGELFSIPARTGDTRNMTRTSGVRERFPRWSPNGQTIAYLSDQSGNWEVYTQPQLGGEATRLTNVNGTIPFSGIGWSPDGRWLELRTEANDLYILNVDTRELKHVLKATYTMGASDWSSDGAWIAYIETGRTGLGAVYLYEVGTGRTTKVTEGYYGDNLVAFDLNGKYLYLQSTRTFAPTFGRYEFSLKVDEADRIYVIPLAADTPNPLIAPNEEEPAAPGAPQPAAGTSPAAPGTPPATRIDLEGLADRAIPLPMPAGNYPFIVGANNGVLYATTGRGIPGVTLAKFDLGTRESQTIYTGPLGQLSFNPQRTKMAGTFGGQMAVLDVRPGANPATGRVDVGGVDALIDPREEWRQMFWDAWRYQRDNFYDPNMLGVNWMAIGRRYEQYLPFVGHRSDLSYVIGMMIGELGTGHAYVQGGDMGPMPPPVSVAQLGADYEVVGDHVRFRKIYYGQNFEEDRRGPLGEPGTNVKEGEYLLAIDGQPVTAQVHPGSLLLNKAGRFVTLTINSQPTMDGARRVRVRPIASEANLRYVEWAEANRRHVEQMSGGRIGYMHIPNTATEGAIEFIRGFYSQSDKDAMIVDERWNGGGFVQPWFVDTLARQSRVGIQNRNSADVTDAAALEGPKVMLINEYAGSGGDFFPWMFKESRLGPLIGRRTWGGLVGIAGSQVLVDGGTTTSPEFALFDRRTNLIVAENTGVDPDIDVDMRPDLVAVGRDPQLEKAIEHLMEQVRRMPPRPQRTEIPRVAPPGRVGGG